mmetsp:Transcript_7052/g.21483  ORF Transcript_7052/g.21483 Transcript_7052/m.21483 type:complete len:250 (-) Transcript_7052:283-1032(-)
MPPSTVRTCSRSTSCALNWHVSSAASTSLSSVTPTLSTLTYARSTRTAPPDRTFLRCSTGSVGPTFRAPNRWTFCGRPRRRSCRPCRRPIRWDVATGTNCSRRARSMCVPHSSTNPTTCRQWIRFCHLHANRNPPMTHCRDVKRATVNWTSLPSLSRPLTRCTKERSPTIVQPSPVNHIWCVVTAPIFCVLSRPYISIRTMLSSNATPWPSPLACSSPKRSQSPILPFVLVRHLNHRPSSVVRIIQWAT